MIGVCKELGEMNTFEGRRDFDAIQER